MHQEYPLKSYLLSIIICGFVSLILAVAIQSANKNIWLLQYSPKGIIFIFSILIPLLILIWLLLTWRKRHSIINYLTYKVTALYENEKKLITVIFLCNLGILACFYFFLIFFTEEDQSLKAIYVRIIPVTSWLFFIFCLTILGLIQNYEGNRRWVVNTTIKFFVISMSIFILGFIVHTNIGSPYIRDTDTYYLFREGQRLLFGKNPYERILNEALNVNQKFPTHFPVFYLLAMLTQKFGLIEYYRWLDFWTVIFLFCNLATALLLLYIPYRAGLIIPAVFSSLFWLFNHWTMYASRKYALDFIPIFLFVLSIFLFSKHKWLSLLIFSLSLGIKHIAILMVPIYLIWIWQEHKSIKEFALGVLLISSIPLISSAPFLLTNSDALIKSIIFSATRDPGGHEGMLRHFFLIFYLPGAWAKLPLLFMLFLTCLISWKYKLLRYSTALLVMSLFADFNSVFFYQYLAWVMPFIPLTVYEVLSLMKNRDLVFT